MAGSEEAPPPFPDEDLERLLVFGSLPGLQAESTDTRALTLEAYVDNYVEEEIRREASVRDVGAFTRFLRLAAGESGRTVNVASLSQESGVAESTLRSFYGVLVDTFVGYWLEPYTRRPRKRVLTTPRFYLFDLGVRNAAAGFPLEPRLLEVSGGGLLEHHVALELIARAGYRGRGHRVSFWRTRGGAEVDFVFESPHEDFPIEVKWTDKPTPKDARHVERFLDEHAERARRGLVVCRTGAAQQLTDRVLAIPWWLL